MGIPTATLDPFETFMTGLAGRVVLPEGDDQILPVQLGGNDLHLKPRGRLRGSVYSYGKRTMAEVRPNAGRVARVSAPQRC